MGRLSITCCMNCEDRFVGCHSTCEKYLAEKENNTRTKEKIAKSKPINYRHEASLKKISRSNCIYKRANTHKVLGG